MKKIALTLMLAVAGIGLAAAQTVPAERASFSLPQVLEVVGKLVAEPAPRGLSAEDQKAYAAQTEWLKSVHSRLQALDTSTRAAAPRDSASGLATGKRQHKPAMPQPELDSLRTTVEAESKRFDTGPAVLRSRHETAMNAIRNMKA